MVKEKQDEKDVKRKNLSFLSLIFPSLLLAIIPLEIGGSIISGLVVKIIILGYQYYMLQNFIESVY